MKTENIPRYIIWLKSLKSNKTFPHLVFSADVDSMTTGMVSLTSNIENEIVISILNSKEYSSDKNVEWVKRINSELNRNDLKYIKWIRSENCSQKKKLFESYRNYWKRVKPYKNYYQDISDSAGESLQIDKESISDFIKNGGNIISHKFY